MTGHVHPTSLSDLCLPAETSDFPVACARDGTTICFHTFQRDTASLTLQILKAGCQNWALSIDDPYHFATAFFAVLQAGATPILLPHAQPDLLDHIAEHADGLIAGPETSVSGLVTLRPGMAGNQTSPSLSGVAARINPQASVVLWTSGSTGKPALITKPLLCLDAEVKTLEALFGADRPISHIAGSVGHQHIYGLLFRILWPLASRRIIWRPLIRFPEDITFLPHGSFFISSPAFLKRAAPVLDTATLQDRCARIFSSGGPLTNDVAAYMAQIASEPVWEIYGSTETGGVAVRQTPDAAHPPAWTPMPSTELKVVEGHLSVRSPHIPGGDWFNTQDRVHILANGDFELQGRTDRIAKIEEKRVSLTQIEQLLNGMAYVAESRVLVMEQNGRSGIGAVIMPSNDGWQFICSGGRQAFRDLLKSSLGQSFEGVTLPKWWRFVKQLPRSTEGKTSEQSLRFLFSAPHAITPTLLQETRGDNHVTITMKISADIVYFRGHFPEAPILPGVAQLHWAIGMAQGYFGIQNQVFLGVDALKFQKIIQPDTVINLLLDFNPAKNVVSFNYVSGDERHSSGRLLFGNRP